MAKPFHKRKPRGGKHQPHRRRGPKTSHTPTSRDHAIELLAQWHKTEQFPNRQWENRSEIDPLTRELVWGVIRRQSRLNAWIQKLSKQQPAPILLPALWIGLYQILELDGIADHAAVNETVQAARRKGCPKPMLGYLNAVLRRTTREKEELLQWMEQRPLHIRSCHPLKMLDRWQDSFTDEQVETLLAWNNGRGHTIVRRTAVEADKAEWQPDHESFTIELEPHEAGEGWYTLPRGTNPTSLPGFREGAWYVQDPSTRIAPQLANAQPGEVVLDACAAPGGKTALLAEAMNGEGELIAADRDPARVKRLKENMERLRLDQVQAQPISIFDTSASWKEKFDLILLDVPCSNTGVLQRRPDARWRFSMDDLEELTILQANILGAAVKLLKPGGRIVYSTCSIEQEEGPEQVRNFLERQSGWSLDTERLLLPGEANSDGCYAAVLRSPA